MYVEDRRLRTYALHIAAPDKFWRGRHMKRIVATAARVFWILESCIRMLEFGGVFAN